MPVILLSAPTTDLTPESALGSGATLIWDDVDDYIPAELKDVDRTKAFQGPTDPSTVTGVVLNKYDAWVPSA